MRQAIKIRQEVLDATRVAGSNDRTPPKAPNRKSALSYRPVSDCRLMRRSIRVWSTTEMTITRPKASWV